MSFLGKLFGRKAKVEAPSDPAKDPNMIRVYDSYGRELFITRDDWRNNVLAGALTSKWDTPTELYDVIVGALKDGFRADVVDAAQHLHRTDPDHVRGTCIWAVVLLNEGRLDEAERVLRDHLKQHGENGFVLTNLAKVFADRKDAAMLEKTLWRALEVDPNQDNGAEWYAALHRESGGETGYLAALQRLSMVPGSWRAQMWLGAAALKSGDLSKAIALFSEGVAHAPSPTPSALLQQISGDLGMAGHLSEILQIVEPRFDVHAHGLDVGNNLIKAHLDLGHLDAAQRIVDQLHPLNRPDWKQTLGFWDTEIGKARIAAEPNAADAPFKLKLLSLAGPIWLKPDSTARPLFPCRESGSPAITFIGGSVEQGPKPEHVQQQLTDWSGRVSRGLPLFLAEQVELGCRATVETLVLWVVSPGDGFALTVSATADASAVKLSTQGEHAADYAVTSHVKIAGERWTVVLRLVRVKDSLCLGELVESFVADNPMNAIAALAQRLLELLAHVGVERRDFPPAYLLPPIASVADYVQRLEQLLATRCGGMDGVNSSFLTNPREILDGNIQQCVNTPSSSSLRILLAQTFVAMKRIRPDILPEFAARIQRLQKEHPLEPTAHAVVEKMLSDVLT